MTLIIKCTDEIRCEHAGCEIRGKGKYNCDTELTGQLLSMIMKERLVLKNKIRIYFNEVIICWDI